MQRRQILEVGVEQLDFDDHRFALSGLLAPSSLLIESIRRVGIIVPLLTQKKQDGGDRIVAGFKRAKSALELGLRTVPCLLVPEDENPEASFLKAVLENAGSRGLNEIEKGMVVRKWKHDFHVPDNRIVADLMPLIGVRSDFHHFHKYLKIGALGLPMQQAVFDSVLDHEVAVGVSSWSQEEQERFLDLIQEHRPGRNRQKELLSLWDDLQEMARHDPGHLTAGEITQQARCASVSQADRSPQQRFDTILESLRRCRYPVVTEYERRYRELRKAMAIPPEIQFNPPPFFEGTRISISFSISSPAELSEISERLGEISRKEALEELFKML